MPFTVALGAAGLLLTGWDWAAGLRAGLLLTQLPMLPAAVCQAGSEISGRLLCDSYHEFSPAAQLLCREICAGERLWSALWLAGPAHDFLRDCFCLMQLKGRLQRADDRVYLQPELAIDDAGLSQQARLRNWKQGPRQPQQLSSCQPSCKLKLACSSRSHKPCTGPRMIVRASPRSSSSGRPTSRGTESECGLWVSKAVSGRSSCCSLALSARGSIPPESAARSQSRR